MIKKRETYIKTVKEYLLSVTKLPSRGKKVLVSSVVEEIRAMYGVNIPVYKNSICRSLINDRCREQGIEGIQERPTIKNGEEDPAAKALRKHLENLSKIPERNGKVNATEIARKAGIKRSDLYRGRCRELLNQACESKGIIGIEFEENIKNRADDHIKMQLEKENSELKKKNSALYAEINYLCKRLNMYEKIECLKKAGIIKSDIYRGTRRQPLTQDLKSNENEEDRKNQAEKLIKMQLENENSDLKKKNSALYAEVSNLRTQLKRFEKIEHLMKQGHQVIL